MAMRWQNAWLSMRMCLWIICAALTFNSCERLKRHSADLSDKVSPEFDPINPDTRFNKKRFSEFFGFNPTNDVTALYCYSDELGIDASYYFSFKCGETTVRRIKKDLKLNNDSTSNGPGGFDLNYDWWDNEKISTIKPLTRKDGSLYWYLWYDKEDGKVYFLTFDM